MELLDQPRQRWQRLSRKSSATDSAAVTAAIAAAMKVQLSSRTVMAETKTDVGLPLRRSIRLHGSIACDISSLSATSSVENQEQSSLHDEMGPSLFLTTQLVGRAGERALLEDAFVKIQSLHNDNDGNEEEECGHDDAVPLVVVHGAKGTGKTLLVQSIRDRVSDDDGCFVLGNFEPDDQETTRNIGMGPQHQRPHNAIAEALADLCDLLRQRPERTHLVAQLQGVLSPEQICCLTKLVRNLPFLMDGDNPSKHTDSIDTATGEQPQGPTISTKIDPSDDAHLAEGVCRFLRCVATKDRPIVLVLEDLHRADQRSMEVVKTIVHETQCKHVLIVATFCDTTARRNALLSELNGPGNHNVVDIKLSNLNVTRVGDILSELTNHTAEEVRTLAELIHKKTLGNPEEVQRFLRQIQGPEKVLLRKGPGGQWKWDCDQIHNKTSVADNVVESALTNIDALPSHGRTVLLLAAFLSAANNKHQGSFDANVLEMICRNGNFDSALTGIYRQSFPELQGHDQCYGDRLEKALLSAVELRLLEKVLLPKTNDSSNRGHSTTTNSSSSSQLSPSSSSSRYKFASSKIRIRFYDIIGKTQAGSAIHQEIGRLLGAEIYKDFLVGEDSVEGTFVHQDESNGPRGTEHIFLATDQLNLAQPFLRKECKSLIKLNLEAAKVAKSELRFEDANQYLRSGVLLMDRHSRWSRDYETALELYTSAAESEFATGNVAMSSKAVEEVLMYGRGMVDKIRANFVKARAFGAQGRIDMAIEHATSAILATDPTKFRHKGKPSRFQRWKSSRKLQAVPDQTYLSTRIQPDRTKESTIVQMFASLAMLSLSRNDAGLLSTSAAMMLKLTLKHGLMLYSPIGFGAFAALKAILLQYDEADRFVQLAVSSIKRLRQSSIKDLHERDLDSVETQLSVMVNCFVRHWKQPLQEVGERLHKACLVGLHCNDVEAACNAKMMSLIAAFHCGRNLNDLSQDMNGILHWLRKLGFETASVTLLPVWYLVQNLLGYSDDEAQAFGETMSPRDLSIEADLSYNDLAIWMIRLTRLCRRCIFAEVSDVDAFWTAYHRLYRKQQHKQLDTATTHFSSPAMSLYTGLAQSSSYLQTQKRKYKVAFRQTLRMVDRHVQKGAANCQVVRAILRAEKARLKATGNTTAATTPTTTTSTEAVGEETTGKSSSKPCPNSSLDTSLSTSSLLSGNERGNTVQTAYDIAINLAMDEKLVHYEGLANSLAAAAHRDLGQFKLGRKYDAAAYQCYSQWGANAKMEDLEADHPDLAAVSVAPRRVPTIVQRVPNASTGD